MDGLHAHLSVSIQDALQLHSYDTATFLAEQLVALRPCEASSCLLAECFVRQGLFHRARQTLLLARGPEARYLLAHCCVQLGMYDQAEAALLQILSNVSLQSGAGARSVCALSLLGSVCQRTNRAEDAAGYYRRALELDPLHWTAAKALADMGALDPLAKPDQSEIDAATSPPLPAAPAHAPEGGVVQLTPPGSESDRVASAGAAGAPEAPARAAQPPARPGTGGPSSIPRQLQWDSHPSAAYPQHSRSRAPFPGSVRDAAHDMLISPLPPPNFSLLTPAEVPQGAEAGTPQGTPGSFATPAEQLRGAESQVPGVPQKQRGAGGAAAEGGVSFPYFSGVPPSAPGTTPGLPGMQTNAAPAGGGKRAKVSGRLFESSAVAPEPDLQTPPLGAQAGLRAAVAAGPPGRSPAGLSLARAALWGVLEGYRLLHRYRCSDALVVLLGLPAAVQRTTRVQILIGACHMENLSYGPALAALREARQVDPTCAAGLDLESTALWQLRRSTELATLAQVGLALDRRSPQAWCAAGNCLSLQSQHEEAVRCFRRAVALDPRLAYAHTLCGHELLAMGDTQGAYQEYKEATMLSPRHYKAWFGLGMVYAKEEKWEQAAYHYQRGLGIHPQSAVLRCHHGLALARQGMPHQALSDLQRAIQLDPSNPLARYEKAGVLMDLQEWKAALEELSALKNIAPLEPSVHEQLGRVYRKLGQTDKAMLAYTTALDLKPPASEVPGLRRALDRINVPDDSDSEEI
ncbi:unnamed protein product [Pedinophyceae sp. YPF-701]|nr:unnamed protein product [Pedinophyceae sp. YPF-701]